MSRKAAKAFFAGRTRRSYPANDHVDRFGKVIDMNRPETTVSLTEDVLDHVEVSRLLPFADVDDERIKTLLSLAKVHRVGQDKTFFDEGDSAENFFLLLDGFIRIARTTKDGDQVVMLHLAPGEMFGIAKAYDSDNYTMTARAVSEGLALSWPSDLWDKFIQDDPGFKAATRKALGLRMSEMQDRVISMATRKVESRIADAVLRLAQQTGKPTDQGVEIGFPLTRQDISEMTGTTLHSVSRCLSKWQREGIVWSERCRVVLCRPEALPA